MSYNGDIFIESAVISQFLADAHPSILLPASNVKGGALQRARINFFVDSYFSKVQAILTQFLSAKTCEQIDNVAHKFVTAVAKEIEPLLRDTKPFFGGCEQLTLAEVSQSVLKNFQIHPFE